MASGAEEVDRIVRKIRKEKGKKFVDVKWELSTQNGAAQLFRDPMNPYQGHMPPEMVEYLRPDEFCPDPEGYEIFKDGIEPGDVIQGQLGDCWLLGALSVLGTRPKLLENLFVSTKHGKKYGIYCLKIYKEGAWVDVIIDDVIPCGPGGKPLYSRCRDPNEIWVMLLEKAYAKMHSCYENLISGFVDYGLRDLTGGCPMTIKLTQSPWKEISESGDLWNKLLYFQKEGCLMGCSVATKGKVESDFGNGILQGHAYGLLDLQVISDVRLLRVRNPWGQREWTGPWSDNSPEWTDDVLAELNSKIDKPYEFGDDGTFWMAYEDFVRVFNTIYLCGVFGEEWNGLRVQGEWTKGTAGGCLKYATWKNNVQYVLTVQKKTTVFILLSQRDVRLYNQTTYDDAIGFLVHVSDDPDKKVVQFTQKGLVGKTPSYVTARDVSILLRLDPLVSKHYVILPTTFKPEVLGKYYLYVFSNRPVQLAGAEELSDFDEDDEDSDDDKVIVNDEDLEEGPGEEPRTKDTAAMLSEVVRDLSATVRELKSQVIALTDKVAALEKGGVAMRGGGGMDSARDVSARGGGGATMGGTMDRSLLRASDLGRESLRDIYERRCREYGIRPNSTILNMFPTVGRGEDPEVFDFSRNVLGERGVLPVCDILRTNKKCHTLLIGGNSIKDEGCVALVSALKGHPSLRRLDVSNNGIVTAGREIARLLKETPTLRHLKFDQNDIDEASVRAIRKALDANIAKHELLKNAAKLYLATDNSSAFQQALELTMASAYPVDE
eukprot:Rmarinus@m.9918